MKGSETLPGCLMSDLPVCLPGRREERLRERAQQGSG